MATESSSIAPSTQVRNGEGASADTSLLQTLPTIRASSVRPARVIPEDTAFRTDAFKDVIATSGAEVSRLPKGESMPDMEEYVRFSAGTKDEYRAFAENFASSVLGKIDSGTPAGRERLKAIPYAEDVLKILGVADKKLGTSEYNAAIQSGVDKLLSTPDGWMYMTTLMEQETELMESAAGFSIASLPAAERDIVGKALQGIYGKLYTGEGEGIVHQLDVKTARFIHEEWDKVQKVLKVAGIGSVAGLGTALVTSTGVGAVAGLVTSLGVASAYGIWSSARKSGESITRSPSADRLESIRRNPQLVEYMKLKGVNVSDFRIDENGQVVLASPTQESTIPIGEMLNGAMRNRMTRRHFMADLRIPPSVQDISDVQGYLNGTPERTSERRAKMVKDRFDALGGRAELAASTVGLTPDGFIDEAAWREKHQVPTADQLGLPPYDPNTIHPRAGAVDVNGTRKGHSDLEDVFWGKGVPGVHIGRDLNNIDYNEGTLISRGGVTILPNSPDQWGQLPGDAGYGVEKREARRVFSRMGREKTEGIRTTGNHIPDLLGNASEQAIGFARTDGREIRLPDRPYPDAIEKRYDSHTRKMVDFSKVIYWTDESGNSHQRIIRQDVWDQQEYIDIARAQLVDEIRNVGINPEDIKLTEIINAREIQREIANLGIAQEQLITLTHDSLYQIIDAAGKSYNSFDVDGIVNYAALQQQITTLGIDVDSLTSDQLYAVIGRYNQDRIDANNEPVDFNFDGLLNFAGSQQQLNQLQQVRGDLADKILQYTPDLRKNRFFGILDIKNLRDVDGNPISVRPEQMIVNNDPPDTEDDDGQHPNALFYKIFDGRRVALPEPDERSRKRIYKSIRRWGRVVGYEVTYDDSKDVWGQERQRRKESHNDAYFLSFNAGLLGAYNPAKNVAQEYLQDLHGQEYFKLNPELANIDPDRLQIDEVRDLVRTQQSLAAVVGLGISEDDILSFVNNQEFANRVQAAGINPATLDLDAISDYIENRNDFVILERNGVLSEQTLLTYTVPQLQNACAAAGLDVPDDAVAQDFLNFIHIQSDLASIRKTGISDNEIVSLTPDDLRETVRDRLQQKNPYFARRRNTESGIFTPEHFDRKYWTDAWNQPYYLPDGKRNWFFGRTNRIEYLNRINTGLPPDQRLPVGLGELEAMPLNLDLFRPVDLQDSLLSLSRGGRQLPNENVGRERRIMPRRLSRRPNRSHPAAFEVLNKSQDHFLISVDSAARDGAGRAEDDARFGLTEAQIRQALLQYKNDPSRTPQQQQAVDVLLGRREVYDELRLEPNYNLFNWHTGRDVFDQWPWDPNFCRIPGQPLVTVSRDSIDGFRGGIDRQGRRDGDKGFGTMGSIEAMVDVPGTLDRLRRARTQVIMFFGERLLSREYANPNAGELTAVQREISVRKGEGAAIARRKQEVENRKQLLESDQRILADRKTTLYNYESADKELQTAKKALNEYLKKTFGTTELDVIMPQLKAPLQGTGNFSLPIEGIPTEIKPQRTARIEAEKELYDKKQEINIRNDGNTFDTVGNIIERDEEGRSHVVKSRADIDQETRTLYEKAEAEYRAKIEKINEDIARLSGLQAEIQTLQLAIEEKQKAVEPLSELSRKRDEVLDSHIDDYSALTTGANALSSDELRTQSVTALLNKIHELYEKGRSSNPPVEFGWPSREDDDPGNRERLMNAILEARAQFLEPLVDPKNVSEAFKTITKTYFISEAQLRNLTEDQIYTTINGKDLTEAKWRDQIRTAQSDLAKRDNARRRALDELQEQIGKEIKREDRNERSISAEADLAKLEPMQDILSRYTDVMKKRDDFISNPGKYIPIKTSITADGVTQYDELQMWNDLSDSEKKGYTGVEKQFMEENKDKVPVAYLGILHFFTDYQNDNALVYLDPERHETRATYVKKLFALLPPDTLFDLLKYDPKRLNQQIAIKGDDLKTVLLNFRKSFGLVGAQDKERFAWNRADQTRIINGQVSEEGGVIPLGDRDIRLLVEEISDNLAKEVLASVA